jgi:Zn-dependent peptidase ImmA (M78 family)
LLGASVADDTTDIKQTVKRQTKCQPFAKLKELQADTQANAFAAHLILPNRTQSPPTTRPVDNGQLEGNFWH